jgi:hypothetical protein
MRPTDRLFLFLLIFLIVSGTAPAVKAQTDCTPVTAGTSIDSAKPVSCDVAPICYSSEITDPAKVYYYSIDGLVAGEVLTIDVDTDGLSSSLDSVLEVFDSAENGLDFSDDDPAPGEKEPLLDPYLAFTVPADGGGTYVFGISANGSGADTGTYTFSLQCSDQPAPSEFKWPVEVGDLLGATGSDTGSLINITPENAKSSLPFALSVGPIADIEFDPSSNKLFVAINESPGSIITFDPATGDQDQTFNLVPVTETVPTVVALEAVENMLYGVQVDSSSGEEVGWVLVTMVITPGTAKLNEVVSFESPVRSLAYHPSEKILYGAIGTDLIKIDPALAPVDIQEVVELTGLDFEIASMDFSHEDVLYVVDVERNLFEIDLTTAQAEFMGVIDVSAKVSGLTFVVGEPPDVDPVITACSSTLTNPMTAGSEIAGRKFFGFRLKRHHKHRAVGFFKFQATAGESVTIRLAADEQIFTEAEKESTLYKLWKHWSKSKRKGRAFLGLRDAIPGVRVKKKTKGKLPLELTVENLPADGWYYIMAVQPLFRYHKVDYRVDYHLTLDSGDPAAQACQTLEVVWPGDDAEEDFALTDESGDDYLRRGLR